MIRNWMCPELRILVNFWIDDKTLLSRWLNYKTSAYVEWAMPSRRVLISFLQTVSACLLHFVCLVRDCGYQFLQVHQKQYLKSV